MSTLISCPLISGGQYMPLKHKTRLEPQASPGRIAQRKKEKECSTLR
ncbi:Unknown protein sequence [Pseudomonas syringae pv. aceris]|nr:Unknown protein sequence [Pseudomonas syringae pv. aceris]